MFDKTPTIGGETLFLRPLASEDFEGLLVCGGDQRVWADHPDSERYKRENFEKWFGDAICSESALVVVEQKTNEIIGSTRFYFEDTPSDGVSIGYTFLAYRCWGGAVNRELKSIMLNYAFKTFNAVWFHVSPLNKRSQAALLKIGAEHIKDELVSLGGTKAKLASFYKMNREQWRE